MGDEGIRLGKKSFGVGGLTGGEDVVIDSAVRGGGISETSVECCRSVVRMFASLVNAGGLSSIMITSLTGCRVEFCNPPDLGRWGGVTGKRSSVEFSWLGSWSEHKEGVSSVEPEPRVGGLGFAIGRIADGRGVGVTTERVEGGGCTLEGAWTRLSGGWSLRGIDEKSKEALEVVSRRSGLGTTKRTKSVKIWAIGSTNVRDGPELESPVFCRLLIASAPPTLSLRLSVVVFAPRSGGSTSVPVLWIDARLPVFRNLTDFISLRKAAILSPPRLTVGCPVRLGLEGAYEELMGASAGRVVCFKAALAEERNSSVDLVPDPGNRTGGMYEFNPGGGGGSGGGGGGGIVVCPGCTLGRR